MPRLLITALFLCCLGSPLQALETGWIDLKTGNADKATGIMVSDIQPPDPQNNTIVTIAIPKTSLDDLSDIQPVVVYAKDSAARPTPLNISYTWVADYDNNYYGLVINLGRQPLLPIRLYLQTLETNRINP